MPFEDLPLHDPAPSAPPPPTWGTGGPSRWIVLGSVAVIAAAVLAMWWLGRTRLPPTPPTFASATDVPTASLRPKRQAIELPPLDASDDLLRQLVSALSAHPTLARLIATPALVRGAALVVVQIGDGRTPSTPLKTLRPASRAAMVGSGSGTLDPRSYRRWDAATAALVSLPPEQVAQLYVNVKPLFDQAFQELGHVNNDFDQALAKAIGTLTETPRLTTDPVVLAKPGYLEHEDPALKALLPVQRQFLLVGPDNQRQIINWLKRLASSLDLRVR